jgi:hypothetical protein
METILTPYYNIAQIQALGLTPDDVYQSAAYCAIDSINMQAEPWLMHSKGSAVELAIPLLKRKVTSTGGASVEEFDVTSPYGYPGIISNHYDNASLISFLESSIVTARDHGIVSMFIRLHPIHHAIRLPEHPLIKQMFHGNTVFVDLRKPIEMIRNEFSTGLKRDIRKLLNTGYSVKINAWEHYSDFISAYFETMTLHSASPYYFFSNAYFEKLRDPELCMHLFTAHDMDGQFVSGALFFAYGKTVQYHLGGTRTDARNSAASKIIFESAISYFKMDGRAALHLGGGVGSAQDALFRFKSAFSKETSRFSTLRIICNAERYQTLSDQLISQKGPNISQDFFPLYRA